MTMDALQDERVLFLQLLNPAVEQGAQPIRTKFFPAVVGCLSDSIGVERQTIARRKSNALRTRGFLIEQSQHRTSRLQHLECTVVPPDKGRTMPGIDVIEHMILQIKHAIKHGNEMPFTQLIMQNRLNFPDNFFRSTIGRRQCANRRVQHGCDQRSRRAFSRHVGHAEMQRLRMGLPYAKIVPTHNPGGNTLSEQLNVSGYKVSPWNDARL